MLTKAITLAIAVLALAGCGAPAESDDESFDQSEDEASACGKDPKCSLGRPKAILYAGAANVVHDVLTNTGRRDLSEAEVNGNHHSYLSGCKDDFCSLYWVDTQGFGHYANVERTRIRVWNSGEKHFLPAHKHPVRRLGGPAVDGKVVERRLVAGTELADIWHPTNGGKGAAPLLGYSCTDVANGSCKYVTGADAPPNTGHGGKGYVAGIYASGKTFFKLDRSVKVAVFRKSDGRKGKAEWVYGYVPTSNGRVYMWVIRDARIHEANGKWTKYRGYLRGV